MPKRGKRISAKRQKELAELKAKKEARKLKKQEKKLSNSGVGLPKESGDYRSATGVLHSRPTARDVKIGGFTLTAYGQELIKDTSIEFTIGRRYGIIGCNGSGKSTFMKCLANREVPIPDHIDIFFLDQEAPPSDRTAIECVIDVVEKKRLALEKEADHVLGEEGPDSEYLLSIYERLEELKPETFRLRAGLLLHGLGFSLEMQGKPTKDMSGGWRMRVSLAQALFIKPTLLLMDEPTNHLDLEACVWLEDYLANYNQCLLVVSHSQEFLNSVCTNIIHITPECKLVNYTGNYAQFVKTKRELEVVQLKAYKKEQEDIKNIKAFIASCGTFSNLVKQAKSKQKILDKMYAKGLTPKVSKGPSYNFKFNACEKLPPPVVSFNNVGFAYSGDMKDALYSELFLGVDMDSRIALVGPNGAGKSTLLKLIVGELTPVQGVLQRHPHLSMARYHQHSVDILDSECTPLEFMEKSFPEMKYEETQWRRAVGRYGITGKEQSSKIKTLSDGMKSRIVFAMMSVKNPNILLLDEPTNHLDMECIDALAESINHFAGGVLLVSHDFRLIDQIAKELWVCDNKTVERWDGDIRSYKKSLLKNMKRLEKQMYNKLQEK